MSNENLMTELEKTKSTPAERTPSFQSAAYQVGGSDWTAMIDKHLKPVNDGFSIDFGSNDTHIAHTSEKPSKGPDDKIGSPEWIAKHAQPGLENSGGAFKPAVPNGSPDKGTINDHDSQAWSDHVKKVNVDNPYSQPFNQPMDPATEKNDYIASLLRKAR